MSLDPTIVQQIPTGADDATDVGNEVIRHLANLDFRDVAHDHESRIQFGEKKYGQRLKVNNGRDALTDAYEECLDALSYLMQAHLEGRSYISEDPELKELKGIEIGDEDFDCYEQFVLIAGIASRIRVELLRKSS